MSVARWISLAVLGAFGLAACGGDDNGPSLRKVSGDGQTGFVGNYAGQPIRVELVNGSGQAIPNVAISFAVTGGGGTVRGGSVLTNASGGATLGAWQFGGVGGQALAASYGSTSVTFNATAAPAPATNFSIEVRYLGTPPAPEVQAAFASAASRWSQIVVGDLPDIVLSGANRIDQVDVDTGIPGVGTITCVPTLADQTIDDIVVFADIRPIDGTIGSNILGFALPAVGRNNFTTVAGCMVFDEDNLAEILTTGPLVDLTLHEMGHVIGFGSIWTDKNLLVGGCPAASPTPYFTGSSGRQAFIASLVAAFTDSIVPVEGNGTCDDGTRDSHWREGVFNSELMTGFLEVTGPNPLSAVTAASVRDLGYVVDDAASDSYSLARADVALQRRGSAIPLVEPRIRLRRKIVE
jgi:hypothetical protein